MHTVYADVVFAVNFAADFLVLRLCGKILSLGTKTRRIAASSVIGGLYGVMDSVFSFGGIPAVIINSAVAVVMCLVSFKPSTKTAFLRLCTVFYAVSFLLAGGMEAAVGFLIKLTGKASFSNSIPVPVIIALFGLMSVSAIYAGRLFTAKNTGKTVNVRVTNHGTTTPLNMLCDSGNVLRDPYSGLPVIILSRKSAEKITGTELSDFSVGAFEAQRQKWRYIPAKTVSGSVLLPAFKVDKISVEYGKSIVDADAVLAFSTEETGAYNDTDGVFPYSLIENL